MTSKKKEYEPMVVVNCFTFCRKHGDEYCYRCFYDHRPTNNFVLDDVDREGYEEIIEKEIHISGDREPINVYAMGAIHVGGDSEDCKCTEHNKVDCGTCFNWVAHLIKEWEEEEYRKKWLKKREKYYRNRDD